MKAQKMTRESEKIFEAIASREDSERIMIFALGWLKSHFSKRESIKEEEIVQMMNEALKMHEKTKKQTGEK